MKLQDYLKKIEIGTYLEWFIKIITINNGERFALWIAKTFFNTNDCGCCRRKELLNQLTNPTYDGGCNQIKLF